MTNAEKERLGRRWAKISDYREIQHMLQLVDEDDPDTPPSLEGVLFQTIDDLVERIRSMEDADAIQRMTAAPEGEEYV